MAKTSRKIVETRNGYAIELVEEAIPLAGKGKRTAKAVTFRVVTASQPRRIVKTRLPSLAEARAIADEQPKPKTE